MQNMHAWWSRAALATIWFILNAQAFAWLLYGAHWVLRTPNLLSAKNVETIQQRIATVTKRIITVLPIYKPADAKSAWHVKGLKQNMQASCSRVVMATMWCILNALVIACVLFDAHWMLRTPNILPGKPLQKRHSNVCNWPKTDHNCATPFQTHWCQIRMNCKGVQ